MNVPYVFFMAESEGLLDTNQSKLNKAVNEFVKCYEKGINIDNEYFQKLVFKKCELENVTDSDCGYIREEVLKRINRKKF
jgi:hypothetical protein